MAFCLSFGLKVLFPLHAPLGGLKGGVLFLLQHREGAGKGIIRQLFFVECVEDNFSWDFKIFLWLSDVEMYSSINCDRDNSWNCRIKEEDMIVFDSTTIAALVIILVVDK